MITISVREKYNDVLRSLIDKFIAVFQKYRGALVWTTRAAGVLLLIVGVLMLTDAMKLLTQYLQAFTPEFLRSRL